MLRAVSSFAETPSKMASTARSYRSSGANQSGNPHSLIAAVRASTWPLRVREMVVALMHKNRFGTELYLGYEGARVVFGRVSYTRLLPVGSAGTRRLAPNRAIQVTFGACERICRSTTRKIIREAIAAGALAELCPANTCRFCHQKVEHSKCDLRRPATYRLRTENLKPRETWESWRKKRDTDRAAIKAGHRTPAAESPQAPIAPPAPVAAPSLSFIDAKRGRAPEVLSRRDCARFIGEMAQLMRASHFSRDQALREICRRWRLTEQAARDALKMYGHEVQGGG